MEKLVGEWIKKKRRCCRKKLLKRCDKPQIKKDDNMVVNISNVPFLNTERDLLSSGFSFFPRPSQINWFELEEAIHQFLRSLHLKEFFYDLEGENEEIHTF